MPSSSPSSARFRLARLVLAVALSSPLAVTGGAVAAAGPVKVLRVAFAIAETSFDPAFASDAASDGVIANIIEPMLDYDYLARPVKLVPRTLEAMPTVEDGGRAGQHRGDRPRLLDPDQGPLRRA